MTYPAPRSRAATVAASPTGPWPTMATVSPMRSSDASMPANPVDPPQVMTTACSSVTSSGMGARFACAYGTATYSACAPSRSIAKWNAAIVPSVWQPRPLGLPRHS